MIRLPLACVALLALGALNAQPVLEAETQTSAAQAGESQGGTAAATGGAPSLHDYVLPDVPANLFIHETDRLYLKPIIAVVADYTFFKQDDSSLAQVGEQEDTRDLRAWRIGLVVRSKREFPWEANFTADYQEPRTRDDTTFRVYDMRFRLPFKHANIDIGKQKQPFVYEVVGLSILNPQQERILSPFFVTRSVGIQASGQLAGDRMTWAGWWIPTGDGRTYNRRVGTAGLIPDSAPELPPLRGSGFHSRTAV
jgi:hypothetical protein